MSQKFEHSINEIVNAGKKFRETRREIFKAILTSATIYKDALDIEKKDFDSLLDDKCAANKYKNIESTSHLHKMTKLAIGDDTKAVSALVHVVKVALAFQVKPENATAWLVEQGGFQKVRTTYDTDGNKKVTAPATVSFGQADKANIARELLKDKILCRAAKVIDDTAQQVQGDTQRIFIGIQQPDGSIVIQAMIPDEQLLQTALVQYASNQADDVIQEAEQSFQAQKTEYQDIRKTPEDLKGYVEKLSKADIKHRRKPDSAEQNYQDALEQLEQVVGKDMSLAAHYLDRKFDASVNLDPENMPRLRNSKSPHNQMPLVKPTKDQVIKRVLITRMAGQSRPNNSVDAVMRVRKMSKKHAAIVG